MTTLLNVSAGSIVIKDTDGTTVFDTNERLFCVTDTKSGTKALSSFTASNNNSSNNYVNQDNYYDLGAINAAADTVRGSFYVTTSGGSQGNVAGIGWFNASGTYVHYFGSSAPVLGGGTNGALCQLALYTFIASGGHLYLNERISLQSTKSTSPSTTFRVTLLAPTFQYNLLCGTFV